MKQSVVKSPKCAILRQMTDEILVLALLKDLSVNFLCWKHNYSHSLNLAEFIAKK